MILYCVTIQAKQKVSIFFGTVQIHIFFTLHCIIGIGIVYLFGVFCGSLYSNIFDHGMSLIGGSGGCYALIGSQISCLILNWHEDHAIVIRWVYKLP